MKYIVELEEGVWLDGSGRTLLKKFAKRYNKHGAEVALGLARKSKPFVDARIVEVTE